MLPFHSLYIFSGYDDVFLKEPFLCPHTFQLHWSSYIRVLWTDRMPFLRLFLVCFWILPSLIKTKTPRTDAIGDFWVTFRLCFKASPGAKPFIWKLVLFTCKFWFIYIWIKLISIWKASHKDSQGWKATRKLPISIYQTSEYPLLLALIGSSNSG